MIFSNNKHKIERLEFEIKDLKERVFALEQSTKYYTDTQLLMFQRGVGCDAFGQGRHYETVPLASVVRKIAEHLGMTVNISQPQPQKIEASFGDNK